MKTRHPFELLELPVETRRGPERPLAYGHCVYCGSEVLIDRGSFRAHNWGMRLCPGSWQSPRSVESENVNELFRVAEPWE